MENRIWKGGRWSRKEDREGMRWKLIRKELGGWLGGRSEKERRTKVERNRKRVKEWREKRKREEEEKEEMEVKRAIKATPNASTATIVNLKPLENGKKIVVLGRRNEKKIMREALKELNNLGEKVEGKKGE